MALFTDTIGLDDPESLELDEFDIELASTEDRRYIRSYANRVSDPQYDYDYSRDDYPYGPNQD